MFIVSRHFTSVRVFRVTTMLSCTSDE